MIRPLLKARPAIRAVLLFAVVAIAGCRKPEENIGDQLLDPSTALGTTFTDTTSILAWTLDHQNTITSGLSRNVLGSYLDPVFGPVKAGIVTQLRLSANSVGAGISPDTLQCDSLVLALTYDASTYGYGGLEPQVFAVYRLDQDLRTDTSYTNDQWPSTLPGDLYAGPDHLITPHPTTRLYIGGDSLLPQLRLRLSNALGTELLNHWGQAELANSDAFVAYFKGLLIEPQDEPTIPLQRAALYFNLLSGQSRMTLYYSGTGAHVPYKFEFNINSSCQRYTVSRFDHAQAIEPGLPQAIADTTLGQQAIYLQALGGPKAELRFPFLDTYQDQGLRALSKAELVLPISGTYYPLYAPPPQVFVFRKADDGSDLVLPDQTSLINDVGGYYDATNNEYRLVITRWVQGVIKGTYPNTGLSLVPGGRGVSVNRGVLSGPAAATRPMRLRLTFTTY